MPPSVPVSGQGEGSCFRRLWIREKGACCSQKHEMTDQRSVKKGAEIAHLLTSALTQVLLYGQAPMCQNVLYFQLSYYFLFLHHKTIEMVMNSCKMKTATVHVFYL